MVDEPGQILRHWARRVLLEKGWEQKDWAKAADVDASTVHRILTKADYAPRYGTLEKLCAAAGSRPDGDLGRGAAGCSVPMMSLERLRDCLAMHHVIVPSSGREGHVWANAQIARPFACNIVTESFVAGGFHPGDLVICQPISERLPSAWDLVLIDLSGPKALSVGRYGEHSIHHEPMGALDRASVKLLGVVIQLIRQFLS
jgi:DNA-binding Xre family transcriptional regulator